jgi:hypothetical protein
MQHATSRELAGFRAKDLPAGQLLQVSRHLCECAACNRAYRAMSSAAPALPAIALENDPPFHLTYEQIAEGLDAPAESPAWIRMEHHIAFCAACAAEVRDLRAFDAQLATVPVPAAAPAPSLLDALFDFFRAPQRPAFAGLALSAMAIGLLLVIVDPNAAGVAVVDAPHTDIFQTNLAPRSIAGAFLALAGACGLILHFRQK